MKRIAFSALAMGLGCAVALLFAEAALRVSGVWIGRHSDTMFSVIVHDDAVGWKMRPGIEQDVDFVDVEGIAVRSNSAGFWDREFDGRAGGSACRVAFLGDSFTWGMGVEEHERFTNLIDSTVPSVDAYNFGMPGFGTDQSVLTWEAEARRHRPDVVVLTVYENDYVDNVHDVRYGRPKPYFEAKGGLLELHSVPVTRETFWDHGIYNRIATPYAGLYDTPVHERSRALHWLVKHSDLVRFLYRLSQSDVVAGRTNKAAKATPPAADAPQPTATSYTAASHPAAPAVSASAAAEVRAERESLLERRLILELRRRVEATGSAFIVAFAGRALPQVRADIDALRVDGVSVLDLTTDVIRARHEGPVYFPYNQHWTAGAHAVVADLVAGFLEDTGACGIDPDPAGEVLRNARLDR